MVAKLQKRTALCRKLHLLRDLTSSKSVEKNSIIMDAVLHIYMLNLKLEAIKRELSNLIAIKREYLALIKQAQMPKKDVKIEKVGKGFLVRVFCKKTGANLVSILEVLDQMGLSVLHGKMSCNFYFVMEAIVVAEQEEHNLDEKTVTQTLLNAIERQERCTEVALVN